MDTRTILDRAVVVLRAAPTVLVAVAVAATMLLDELDEVGPVPAWTVTALTGLATVATVATLIVRRVTPVAEELRGLLPDEAG